MLQTHSRHATLNYRRLIYIDKTEKIIRELKTKAVQGRDGWYLLRNNQSRGSKAMVQILTRLFNYCFERKTIPKSWKTAEM